MTVSDCCFQTVTCYFGLSELTVVAADSSSWLPGDLLTAILVPQMVASTLDLLCQDLLGCLVRQNFGLPQADNAAPHSCYVKGTAAVVVVAVVQNHSCHAAIHCYHSWAVTEVTRAALGESVF